MQLGEEDHDQDQEEKHLLNIKQAHLKGWGTNAIDDGGEGKSNAPRVRSVVVTQNCTERDYCAVLGMVNQRDVVVENAIRNHERKR